MSENTVWDMTNAPEETQRKMLELLSGDASWTLDLATPNQRINASRKNLVSASEDVRKVVVKWASDPNRAATDISVNSLMEVHLHIAEAIKALNQAQRMTKEE